MKIFDRNKFVDLSKKSSRPFVSIYLPASRISTDGYKQDKIHLKNQLAQIERQLGEEYQLAAGEIKRLLSPAEELLSDSEFWKYNSDMIACYLYDGQMELFQIPISIQDSSHFVGTKPYLLPLLPEITDNGHYYILVVNLDRIRLYEATRSVIQEVLLNPDEISLSYTHEELQYDNQKELQGQGGVGKAGTMFHGFGEGSDEDRKASILDYFHRMNNELERTLNENPLPLYLAGVDYLIPLYRESSTYTNLQDGYILGSFTEKDMDVLHQRSWELAEPYFAAQRNQLRTSFDLKQAGGMALKDDTETLLKAAFTGAIDTMFISKNHKHIWGEYDADNYRIKIYDHQSNGSHCLVDEAATCVIRSKGNVYLTEPEDMPGESLIAGILRYPVAG